jgi:hypothetical protein
MQSVLTMRRRNSKKNHKRLQFIHTRRRAAERFGVALTQSAYKQIIQDIQKGAATFLKRQSNMVTIWQVTAEEEVMVAFYDKRRKTIKTVLTPDQYEETFNDATGTD